MTDRPDQADVRDRTLGDLGLQVTRDLSRLVHQEIDLAKTELKEDVGKAGQGAGLLGGAGLTGVFTLAFASLAAVYALDKVMDRVWAALIVAAAWAVLTAALAIFGRSRLRQLSPPMERTTQSLKEDAQWVKTRNS